MKPGSGSTLLATWLSHPPLLAVCTRPWGERRAPPPGAHLGPPTPTPLTPLRAPCCRLLFGWSGEGAGLLPGTRAFLLRFARGLPVLAWLAPAPEVFGSQPLLSTTGDDPRHYSAADMGDLLREAGAVVAGAVWEAATAAMQPAHAPPAVRTTCMYSLGVPTAVHATLASSAKGAGAGARLRVRMGDGDGTVAAASLMVCDAWASATPLVCVRRYHGVRHAQLLQTAQGQRDVVAAVLELGGAAAS